MSGLIEQSFIKTTVTIDFLIKYNEIPIATYSVTTSSPFSNATSLNLVMTLLSQTVAKDKVTFNSSAWNNGSYISSKTFYVEVIGY